MSKGFTVRTSDGKLHEVVHDHVYGLCTDAPVIYVDSGHKGKEALNTWIHEGVHAEFPKLSEAGVVRLSNFLADLLWKAGYRGVYHCRTKKKRPDVKGTPG